MNLEKVKEHFKNAEKVRCLLNGDICIININSPRWDYFSYIGCPGSDDAWFKSCKVWDEHEGFAEIISYKKDAQRIKEDCELLENYEHYLSYSGASFLHFNGSIEDFKKDNGLTIEPTELDKLKQSYNELIEKAEEIKQQIDNLK